MGHQRHSRVPLGAHKPPAPRPNQEHLAHLATRAVSGHRDTHESTSDTTDRPKSSSGTVRRHGAPIRGTNATPARSAELSRRETQGPTRNTSRTSPPGPSPATGTRSKAPATPPIVPEAPPAPCSDTEHQYGAPTPLPRALGCSQAASPKAQPGTPCAPRHPGRLRTPGHARKHQRHHRSSQKLLRHRAATRSTNTGHQRHSRAIRRAFEARDPRPNEEHLAYLATRAVSGHRDTQQSTSDTTDGPRYSFSTVQRHGAPIQGTNATPA